MQIKDAAATLEGVTAQTGVHDPAQLSALTITELSIR
jgi:hypothetical protein